LSKRSKSRDAPPVDVPPRHCFLSHSHYNEAFVDKLADVLARHRIEAWYSPRKLKGGQQWHDEIGKALSERCNWFLVVLSPSAVKSRWVKHELVYALNNAPFKHGRITPLLTRTCEWRKLSFTLGGIQWVDFRKSFEAGCRALLKSWKIEFRPA
jgi:hypothetical protein